MKPIPLMSGRETAEALSVTQHRFANAVKRGSIVPDFIGNSIDLFKPATVEKLKARKLELFPAPNPLFEKS
jgi:hypothetical protein